MEEMSMLMKNQMLELEKNKIEHEKRYMELHRMKVKNELLKLAMEHLDYMLECQKMGFGCKLEISGSLEMEEKSMLMKNQMLELEKNKIEHEKRYMEFHRMKVKNELLKLAIEHLDYMPECQKRGFGSKLEISCSLEMEEKSMLIKSQMLELEKNKIEHEKIYMKLHRLKVENMYLKLAIEHLDYMLECQKTGFDSKLEISCSLEMEEKSMLMKNQMLELEKNKIEREKRYMVLHGLKVENMYLKLALEHLDYMFECQKRGFDSKLEISCSLEMEEKSMLINNQMLELEKNKIEHEKRYMEVHRLKVENVFLKLANECLAYMFKSQKRGFASKL